MEFDRINFAIGATLVAAVLISLLATVSTVMTSDHRSDVDGTRARLSACSGFEVTSDRLACLAIVTP